MGENLCIIVIVHIRAMHFLMLHLYPKPISYVVHINGPEKLQLLGYKANIKESKPEQLICATSHPYILFLAQVSLYIASLAQIFLSQPKHCGSEQRSTVRDLSQDLAIATSTVPTVCYVCPMCNTFVVLSFCYIRSRGGK